jgi:molecular chaperone DnaK
VRIQVCQGESRRFEENVALGELVLDEIRQARRGEVHIEVTFQIDTDGILRVRARDVETDREQQARMQVRGSMSDAELGAIMSQQRADEAEAVIPVREGEG